MAITRQEMAGKVQTVLGVIDAADLGITLPHEHLIIDMSSWFDEPKEASLKKLAYEPVTIENLGWIWHNSHSHLDNLRVLDEEAAIEESILFKKEGGSTIVDLSNTNMGREPLKLVRISRATGLNVIMGSGYYVAKAQGPDSDRKSDQEIAEEIVNDIQIGVDGTAIRSGIIGEIGCSWPLHDREKKCLCAAARAQQHTGAAINVHSGHNENAPMEIARILDGAGADLSRVVISHIDRIIHPLSTRCDLAKTGCYLEYDFFGAPTFYPLHWGMFDRPCDRERIEQISELIDKGYLNQILISQDICMKMKLVRYGGSGYADILRNIVPEMLARGISKEQIHTIMVENPKQMLQFATAPQEDLLDAELPE